MSDTTNVEGQEDVENFLSQALSPSPRSPGEAIQEAERQAPAEDEPLVVEDEPPVRPTEPEPEEPQAPPAEEPKPGEEEEEEEEEDPNVAWATKKYGEDTTKWARAAYEMEQHIGRVTREKQEAEQAAQEMYAYAQQVEQQAQQTQTSGMPLSSAEEEWIDRSAVNPLEAARQAYFSGNQSLYQGVLARVAEDNPLMAAQVATQVQGEYQAYAAEAQAQQAQPVQAQPLEQTLAQSFGRLGIDLQSQGPKMAEKIGELGEYHPYVQAILGGDPGQTDLAVQAVYDLVRASARTPRVSTHEDALKREGELRRAAAVVQTGGSVAQQQPTAGSSFISQMQEEWERAGQWTPDE